MNPLHEKIDMYSDFYMLKRAIYDMHNTGQISESDYPLALKKLEEIDSYIIQLEIFNLKSSEHK